MRILVKVALLVGSAIIMYAGLVIGYNLGNRDYATNPVCHSKTEDSVITDCNYSNGAWYRK